MKREFNVLIEEDEDGILVGSVPEIHGCHSQAKTLDELMVRMKEAIELCLEIENSSVPTPKFVGFQRMTVEI